MSYIFAFNSVTNTSFYFRVCNSYYKKLTFYSKYIFFISYRKCFSLNPLSLNTLSAYNISSFKSTLTFLLLLPSIAFTIYVSVILVFSSYRNPIAFLTSILSIENAHILSRYSVKLL